MQRVQLGKREKNTFRGQVFGLHKRAIRDVSGFAIEIGEKGQHKNFGAFVRAIRKARGLRVDPENNNSFSFTGTDGRVLRNGIKSRQRPSPLAPRWCRA